MTRATPDFYEDLDAALAESWRLLARGVADRRSPFHHPTLATVGLDGTPQARTVILRGCDPARRMLRLHTDTRSRKAAELEARPEAALHAYDPVAKIQLRIAGRIVLHHADAIADAAWAASRPMSRQVYGIAPGPGTAIAAGGAFALPPPTEDGTAGGRAQFVVAALEVATLEWLYLALEGHRRARFDWTAGALRRTWLAP
jgi:pyridoxamine 5'-phosphate oxidase